MRSRLRVEPEVADPMAGHLVQALARPMHGRLAFSPAGTLLWTFLTGGGVMLLIGRAFRLTCCVESNQAQMLSEWLRMRNPYRGGDDSLRELARGMMPSRWPVRISLVVLLVAMAVALGDPGRFYSTLFPVLSGEWGWRHLCFGALISVAALVGVVFPWLRHHSARRAFLSHLDQQLPKAPDKITVPEPIHPRFSAWPWWVSAAVLGAGGGWWAVLVVTASALHARTVYRDGPAWRMNAAGRVLGLLQNDGRLDGCEIPLTLRRRCNDPACHAPLPLTAGHCPRCGRSTNGRQSPLLGTS